MNVRDEKENSVVTEMGELSKDIISTTNLLNVCNLLNNILKK